MAGEQPGGASSRVGLAGWHDRLSAHFADLARRRAQKGPWAVFALEHGLDEAEVAEVAALVQRQLDGGEPDRSTWLPFVVYATELGYRYEGEEYWSTFASRTPGVWDTNYRRELVRMYFERFARDFNGAKLAGAWADHRSIIAWPITHALLPTDLQIQLAHVLYSSRFSLTANVVNDPTTLGKQLASRSANASARFRILAENIELLGQIASALLLMGAREGPDFSFSGDSGQDLILDTTLQRIAADLSREQQARRWLRAARSSANRLRLSGVSRQNLREKSQVEREAPDLASIGVRPTLSLVASPSSGWDVVLGLPDLAQLLVFFPEFREVLERSQAEVPGSATGRIARGRLLRGGQTVRLTSWPRPNDPLVSLRNAPKTLDLMLTGAAVVGERSAWLFKRRRDGTANEILSRVVRPSSDYVVVVRDDEPRDAHALETIDLNCEGVSAFRVRRDQVLDQELARLLASWDITVGVALAVAPSALVMPAWDGDGSAEWIAGDRPILRVESSVPIRSLAVGIDGARSDLAPPTDHDHSLFLRLPELSVGAHDIEFDLRLQRSDGQAEIVRAYLFASVREPRDWRSDPSLGGVVALYSDPAVPTFDELWEGTAEVQILGPEGAPCRLRLVASSAAGAELAFSSRNVLLPVVASAWPTYLAEMRSSPELRRSLINGGRLTLEAQCGEYGVVSLSAERFVPPLHWTFDERGQNRILRLDDDTGSPSTATIQHATFERPEPLIQMDDGTTRFEHPEPGLYTAMKDGQVASFVVAPTVHDLHDLRLVNSVQPRFVSRQSTLAAINARLDVVEAWTSSGVPIDLLGAMRFMETLREFTAALVEQVVGGKWALLEAAAAREEIGGPAERRLATGLAGRHRDYSFEQEMVELSQVLPQMDAHARAKALAEVVRRKIGAHVIARAASFENRDQASEWTMEFALRLASDPGHVRRWGGQRNQGAFRVLLAAPLLLRSARFAVLSVARRLPETDAALYAGWEWP